MKNLKKFHLFPYFLLLIIFVSFSFVAIIDELVAPKTWAAEEPEGSGTSDDPYLISNANELAYFCSGFENYSYGIYLKQTQDIDLSGATWQGIKIGNKEVASRYLKVNYDGCGYSIKNLSGVGLFAYSVNGTIENVNIYGTVTNNNSSVSALGAVACEASGTYFYNCKNFATIQVEGGNSFTSAGGIVGKVTAGTITNCVNYGEIKFQPDNPESKNYAGGIVGAGDVAINYCANYGKVLAASEAGKYVSFYGGGIIGGALSKYGDGSYVTTVDQCLNSGAIEVGREYEFNASIYAGGISGIGGRIQNSINVGAVQAICAEQYTDAYQVGDEKEEQIGNNKWQKTRPIYEERYYGKAYNEIFGYGSKVENCIGIMPTGSLNEGDTILICTGMQICYKTTVLGVGWYGRWETLETDEDLSKYDIIKKKYSYNYGTNCQTNGWTSTTTLPTGFSSSIWGIGNPNINNGGIYLKALYW